MRPVPLTIAASLLFLAPAAARLRADPPPAAPAAAAAPVRVIHISTRFVKATERAARSLRLLGTVRRPGDEPRYDPAALERRLRCWERAGHAERVSEPRLSVYPGQKANLSLLTPVTYIEDFDLELGMGTHIADPVIQTIQEGLVVECTASLAPRGVTLAASLSLAAVKRPIDEVETTLASGGSQKVRIQVPEVRVRRSQRSVFLSRGTAALLADLPPVPFETDRRVLLVWVEAYAVDVAPAPIETGKQVEGGAR